MNKILHRLKYIISDFLSAASAWFLFFYYRKHYIESKAFGYVVPFSTDNKFYIALVVLPLFWVFLNYVNGYYNQIYRKSRLEELYKTIIVTIIGVIIIFFVLILDDIIKSYEDYYSLITILFCLHFFITYIPRLLLTTRTNHRIQKRKLQFNTLIVGSGEKAAKLFEKMNNNRISSGLHFVGFVSINGNETNVLAKHLDKLGDINYLKRIIIEKKIEEVIIALEPNELSLIEKILNKLEGFNTITVRAIADNCDIISGRAKLNSLYEEPLIQISHELMPAGQLLFKRAMDIFVSIFVLIIFSPVFLFLAVGVAFSSKGSIIYSQSRVGRYGKPFNIYKFRSMKLNAETSGPALSSGLSDERITKFGHFMRKSRLDEMPQFWNVLKGDMSLVGPRPERQHYIDQIMERAPHYVHLHRVRPGITSWGQVRFGYAKDVDEMVERLNYDIIYIENMSLYNDIKILIYTIKTVFLGKGI